MSFLGRSHRLPVLLTILTAVALLATMIVVPTPAAAQDDSPTLRIRKAKQLVHRSVLSFETAGLPSATDFTLVQCPSAAEIECVNLGAGTTDDDGKVKGTFEARRELFLGTVRSDCSVISCVVVYDDGSNNFVIDIDFLGTYPMTTMDVGPLSGVAAGDTLTATANDYRPSTDAVDNTIWMCPENDDSWSACLDVAAITPGSSVDFTIPEILTTRATPYDCAATGQGCYLRIGAYEARWELDFTPNAVDDVLKWGKRKDLRNGEAVQVEVTSTTTDLSIVQCVKPKGTQRTCDAAPTTSTNFSSASRATTQTLTAEVRRYMYVDGNRSDCAAVRCDLEVRVGDSETTIGKAVRIRFDSADGLPEAVIKVPRKKVQPAKKVRITLFNLPEAKAYIAWQCAAGTTDCVKIHEGKIRKAKIRKKVTVVAEVGGVDCTSKRGACTVVVTTSQPETVRLEADLNIKN